MLWTGICVALLGACVHTCIDSLRKYASQSLHPEHLVTLVAISDASISFPTVCILGGFTNVTFQYPYRFAVAVLTSSVLLFLSKLLYQKAVHITPLSLAIPYLSFTPVILVATAYVFLGEAPTISGLAGVAVITVGGYFLSLINTTNQERVDRAADGDAKAHRHKGPALPSLTDVEGQYDKKHVRLVKVRFPDTHTSYHRSFSFLPKEHGPLMMIGVAAIWSVTASIDKLGSIYGPNIWVYFALQRLAIGLASVGYSLVKDRRAFQGHWNKLWLIVAISCSELLAVVLFLEAIKHILVSYVVAIKRCSILFSVLLGGLMFKETIGGRLPYVLLMMFGVLLIVLEPNASLLHRTHNKHLL